MEFKDKIKVLRAERNATLEDIGKAVGVSKTTVQRWESGEIANVRRDKIYKLAKALNTTPSYLMGWDNEDPDSPKPQSTVSGSDEAHLVDLYRELNPEGQERLLNYADDLVSSGKYIKTDPSAMDHKQA